ncbi:MAG: hypothetical protein HZB43_05175 [candidate division Zixibacteria bacterium]|nr:hypothetical protein [candidate division Zixibacteria bacterium]
MIKRLAPMAIIALAIVGCSDKDSGVNPPSYDLTKLNAIKVATDPVVDGASTDAMWADAPALTVSLGDGMSTFNCDLCHSRNSATTVTLKAVHSATKLTVLASWADDKASFTRGESWAYSGGAWTKPNGVQSEDRIAFFWPIGAITGDGPGGTTGGCMTKCHTTDVHPGNDTEDEMHLATGTADIWHMKAARYLGATSVSGTGLTVDATTHQVTGGTVRMTGWCDDQYVAQWSAANAPDGGRFGDGGSGVDSRNRSTDPSRPKFIEKAPTDFMDAMILTQAEVDAGETAGDATTGVSDADAAAYWPAYAALNAVLPERILKIPSGSRGDIVQGAVWTAGRWTVEIQRTLTTSDTDHDVQMTVGQQYTFGVSVMNNAGGAEHKASTKQILKVLE